MKTTRERLERAVVELRSFNDTVEARSARGVSNTDADQLDKMGKDVGQLVSLYKGEQVIEAAGAPGADQYGNLNLSDLASPGGFSPARKSTGTPGAPPFTFSRDEIEGLRQAAAGHQMKSVFLNMKTSSVNVPMSTVPDYRTTVFPFLRDKARILDHIPLENTTAPTIFYHRGSVAASQADTVAEGANKPLSSPAWARVEAKVEKIAHYGTVNDEVIADFPDFTRVLGNEFIGGLIDAENDQLLNGTGVTPDLQGLLTTTGIITRAKGADIIIDALFKATNDLRTGAAFCEPDLIVLHPDDLADVVLSKDSAGNYIAGPPTALSTTSLWGVPILPTTRIASGTGMVANMALATKAFMRETPRLEVNPFGGVDEWKANKTLIRAEERLSLTVPYPKAIVKVTGL